MYIYILAIYRYKHKQQLLFYNYILAVNYDATKGIVAV